MKHKIFNFGIEIKHSNIVSVTQGCKVCDRGYVFFIKPQYTNLMFFTDKQEITEDGILAGLQS